MKETIRVSSRPVTIEILSRDYWGARNYLAMLPARVPRHEPTRIRTSPYRASWQPS